MADEEVPVAILGAPGPVEDADETIQALVDQVKINYRFILSLK